MVNMPYLRGLGLNAHVLEFAGYWRCWREFCSRLRRSCIEILQDARGVDGGRARVGREFWRRMGANLVVVELATAVVLLAGAGLLGKSLYNLLHLELGFQADHLATVNVGLPGA